MTHLTLRGGEEGDLSPLRNAVGSQIASVGYLVPAGAQWPDGREDGLRHEVDHGVELALTNGLTLSLRWEMQGEDEFLAVETSSLRDSSPDSLIDLIDVSNVPEWTSIVGQTLHGLGAAWHTANTGCPSTVWAIRFDVGHGSSFVVALGEIRDDAPAYLPDAVLVLFEKDDAESYRTTASPTSAWGLDIAIA